MAQDQTVKGVEHFVPRLCWYFTFLHARRHFRIFPEIYPVKKERIWTRRIELTSLSCPFPLDHGYLAWRRKLWKIKPSFCISGMEECKIPAWARDKMFRNYKQRAFFIPKTAIFQKRASFWLALAIYTVCSWKGISYLLVWGQKGGLRCDKVIPTFCCKVKGEGWGMIRSFLPLGLKSKGRAEVA